MQLKSRQNHVAHSLNHSSVSDHSLRQLKNDVGASDYLIVMIVMVDMAPMEGYSQVRPDGVYVD